MNNNKRVRMSASSGYSNSLNASKKKLLVIKAFKGKKNNLVKSNDIKIKQVQPKTPEDFEEQMMVKLSTAVEAIHTHKRVADSLEELYKGCENLCLHSKQLKLYERIEGLVSSHIKQRVYPTMLDQLSGSQPSSEVLRVIHDAWTSYCQQTILIRSILLYLDRTFVMQDSTRLKPIWTLCMDLFRTVILDNSTIQGKLIQALLAEIEAERNALNAKTTIEPNPLLKPLLKMLVDLNVYMTVFEYNFLETSTRFYTQLGSQWVQQIELSDETGESVAQYLGRVIACLEQETARCITSNAAASWSYLDKVTHRKISEIVRDKLVTQHSHTLLDCGFDALMAASRYSDLHTMYELMETVGQLDALKTRFASFIKSRGVLIVNNPERDKVMISELLAFKATMDQVLERAFNKRDTFEHSLKEAFEWFVNQRANKPAEMMAKYIDELLKHVKGLSEEQIDAKLQLCLVLFRFIQGKDVFEAFYSKDLAKRLLLGKSASVDAEKNMLSKLKAECGAGFTSKLEGMFKDMEVSRDIQRTFEASSVYQTNIKGVDFSVQVLTYGFWPTYPTMEVTLPPMLSGCQETFKQFYLDKHNGRRLTWHNSLGYCLVKAEFSKSKELHVTLSQTVVLLCFNESDAVDYTTIQWQTGLEERELKRTLLSLSCGRQRVLINKKKSNGDKNSVDKTDVFEFNKGFSSPHYRIKISTVVLGSNDGGRKATSGAMVGSEEDAGVTQKVFQDRVFQVDAAIVRIMKTEKQCSHGMLVNKLFGMLKFPLEQDDVKKRIESLIERDYVKRDDKDRSSYLYVA